jgi:hypothetical protein
LEYNAYMNSRIVLRLDVNAEQLVSLERLQAAFAQVCNELGPLVQETRCWNRVTLHHFAYRKLRERFPALGSQMICNAIYSVSRAARMVFQNRASAWSIEKRLNLPLPLLRFAAGAPVYFDRHTLSLRQRRLSMYTLDGRLRFEVALTLGDEQRFREEKLKEIVLSRDVQGFFLVFSFGDVEEVSGASEFPEYLMILEPAILAAQLF